MEVKNRKKVAEAVLVDLSALKTNASGRNGHG
ncbi:hypothetical protein DaAHT2_0664 [Desulfurivibrio alkaliphilus AHT 2]|uniref:Uncharacterized protein n=1 Tax=Desulfurivibrio alkaliphilus (strain DSM 19089 / UNIQEM U267 / AHT2) TaxID=589865 RepID=D6Z1B3_DESAT|nr:hypothetical protein DaAHT2_0664 [Desulfurivibrio alkaliphilus AHT 2]